MRKWESKNWGTPQEHPDFARPAGNDLRYKLQPEKKGKKVAAGVLVDMPVGGCIAETVSTEESSEVTFNSPSNFPVEREFDPLGSFEDSLGETEGLGEKRG